MGTAISYEGALKLKEVSYLHAEAYAAGEMKHGPIALIDPGFPVIAVATKSPTYDKVVSNLKECEARGATIIALATEGDEDIAKIADHIISRRVFRCSCSRAKWLSCVAAMSTSRAIWQRASRWNRASILLLGIGIASPSLVLWKLATALLPDAVRETAHSKIGGAYD